MLFYKEGRKSKRILFESIYNFKDFNYSFRHVKRLYYCLELAENKMSREGNPVGFSVSIPTPLGI